MRFLLVVIVLISLLNSINAISPSKTRFRAIKKTWAEEVEAQSYANSAAAVAAFTADPWVFARATPINLFDGTLLTGANKFSFCPIKSGDVENALLVDKADGLAGYWIPFTYSKSQMVALQATLPNAIAKEAAIPHVTIPILNPPMNYLFTGQQTGCATVVVHDGDNLIVYHDPIGDDTTFFDGQSPKRQDASGRSIGITFMHLDYKSTGNILDGGFASTFMYHTTNGDTQCWVFVMQRLGTHNIKDAKPKHDECPSAATAAFSFQASPNGGTAVTQKKACLTGGSGGLFVWV